MRKRYDFSNAVRGPVVPATPGQTAVLLRLDDEVLDWFRDQVHQASGGDYQALINAALREHIRRRGDGLEDTLRRVVREELRAAG